MKSYLKAIMVLSLAAFFNHSAWAETVSLYLKNAPFEPVLSFLAKERGENIVLDNMQKNAQNISLQLTKLPMSSILTALAKSQGLFFVQENGVFYLTQQDNPINQPQNTRVNTVENNTKITQSEQKITPVNYSASAISANKMPAEKPTVLTIETVKLKYAKAGDIVEALTKGQGNFLSGKGYLNFDDRSNTLVIKEMPEVIAQLRQVIQMLDKPIEQIAIEARVVTISSESLEELGVRWGIFGSGSEAGRLSGSLEARQGTKVAGNLNVNFPISGAPSVALQVASLGSHVLDLELSALERENNVEIIASPRLLTTNKKRASIKQGTEIPYAVYSKKDEVPNIEFKEAVLGLEVTPHIAEHDNILLDLLITQNAQNSQLVQSNLVSIDKQEINTQIFAQSGETIVLGGIFQHLTSKNEERVPLLGSIPVIKHLFGQQRDKIMKRELVIFVTPYVIRPMNTVRM